MLASVVIPTYRRPALLLNCLLALARQSLQSRHYEIIVVSDGFDEDTRRAIEELKHSKPDLPVITYLHTAGKKGPAAARNIGWQCAQSQYILFTDDDCVPDRDWVAAYVAAFKRQETLAVAFTGKIEVPLPARPTDFEKNTSHLERADFVTANCATTHIALLKAGGFDETFSMAWREDSDLQFNLLKNHVSIQYLENALVVHPAREAPWGVSIREQKKSMFNYLLFKKHPHLYRKYIQAGPPPHYFFSVLSFLGGLFSILGGWYLPALLFFSVWLVFVVAFAAKRLKNTSHTASHICEMLVTSAVIPFASIFWNFWGFLKFRSYAPDEGISKQWQSELA